MTKHFAIVFIFSFLSTGAITQISPDSLLLYLPLNGNTNDYSGNNYNGVNYGAKATPGFSGKPVTAYEFDGTNAIVISNVNKLEGQVKAFTVLVRLKPSIVRNGSPFYNVFTWQRHLADPVNAYEHGKLHFGWAPPTTNYHPLYDFFGYYGDWCTGNDRTSNGYEVDTVTATNQWQTVALVYDQGNMRAYFDCKLMNDWVDYFPKVADQCGTEPMEIIIGSIFPGASTTTARNFIGVIDEVRMYKRALSYDEVHYFADSICSRIIAPVPVINFTANACMPNEVAFADSSIVSGATTIDRRVWRVSNGDSGTGKDFACTFTQTGNYTVRLSLYANGTVYSKDTVIQVTSVTGSRFIKTAQSNVFTCSGTAVQLKVQGGVSYSWQPCDNLSDCNTATPTAQSNSDITYVVTAKDKNKCIDTAHINLKVITNDNNVFVPNAFTPNGDGNNDTWGAVSVNPLPEYNLRIFNRWGLNVFNSKSQGDKWDGTMKNQKAQPGAYVWALTYKNGAGCPEKNVNGTVLLIP